MIEVAKDKADAEWEDRRRKDVLRKADVYTAENARPRKTCVMCSKGKMLLVGTDLVGY